MIKNPASEADAGTGVAPGDTYLIYDGECPFCSSYVKFMRLRETVGPVRLIDARKGGPEVARVRNMGMDLNEGMVFHYSGSFYHGADALNVMALLSDGQSWFNKLNGALFRSKMVARVSYPFMRAGRNSVLRILRRSKLPGP
ncbi:DCC1-like thiol-disulfide oxidoreductase family protein [Novosphingobium sp. KN65.2]|uniref:DCC1-like thiol-disulfide oxidoreductase family protein n=1 Tax=Novosphingobium sp. KN65.2 TaxID=1478134 RepID=UPI0006D593D8|nr:DCC1-like thiol-disulfide oxidoreductase family protein [Novosphingobium sp. KN65.2]